MLRDAIFYPLALVVVAGLVMFALSRGADHSTSPEKILEDGLIVQGGDLRRLTASPGTQIVFVPANSGAPAFAQLSSLTAFENALPSPGVFVTLSPVYERAFAEKKLRLSVRARASKLVPSPSFQIGYFTERAESSGWQSQDLSPEWSDYTVEFQRGVSTQSGDLNFFSIWPGQTAEPLGVDVSHMRIEVLSQ